MELSRIIEIIRANCTVMPSQPSGVVYVFDADELSSTAKLIFNEMQLKGDVPPQLNKHDVSGQLPLTDAEIDAEAELRYPVQTHSTLDNSPYVGSKATFIHGVQWALQQMKGNCH